MKSLSDDVESEKLQSENAAFNNVVNAEVFDILTSVLDVLSPQGRKIIQMIYFDGKKTPLVIRRYTDYRPRLFFSFRQFSTTDMVGITVTLA